MKRNDCNKNFMKAVVLAAALAGGLAASAADITWTEQYLTSANGAEVSTKGTGLDAMSFGNEGPLTFYSEQQLIAGSAENCTIASVESLGQNLWKVNLSGRQWGKKQSVSLRNSQ